MTVLELLARLDGEILSNKARAMVDGKIVILARMEGVDWVYTTEGQELANQHSNEAAAEAESKPAKTRKPRATEPTAETTPVEPVAVESGNVEPEL